MSLRMLDYYQKGLPANVRQRDLPDAMEKIGSVTAEYMCEAPQGYPGFKRMGMDEQQIKNFLERETENFKAVNEVMMRNGRPPLFPNPSDTYQSSLRYFELIYRYHEKDTDKRSAFLNYGKESEPAEKLAEIMGCSWKDYVPETYTPEENTAE